MPVFGEYRVPRIQTGVVNYFNYRRNTHSEDGISTIPYYFGSLKIIVDAVGSLEYKMKDKDGAVLNIPKPQWMEWANPGQSFADLMAESTMNTKHYGNSFLVWLRNEAGRAVELYCFSPREIQPSYNPDYPFTLFGKELKQPVIHIRDFPRPGSSWGIGALDAARTHLKIGHDMQDLAARFYEQGTTAPLVFIPDAIATNEEVQAFKDSYRAHVGGGYNAFDPIVANGMREVKALNLSQEQMQYLETLKHVAHTIVTGIFSLPAAYMNLNEAGTDVTYNNVPAIRVQAWSDAIKPTVRKHEFAITQILRQDELNGARPVRKSFYVDERPYISGSPHDQTERASQMALSNRHMVEAGLRPPFTTQDVREAGGLFTELPEGENPLPQLPEPGGNNVERTE